MSDAPPTRSPFASHSLAEHLGRGLLAALAFYGAVQASGATAWWAMPLSLVLGVAALIALRGCPVCWTIGLVETARRAIRRG